MTPLETSILHAAQTVKAESFGQSLARFNPHRRASRGSGGPRLADYEMGYGPPIARPIGTALLLASVGRASEMTESDRDYLRWVADAHEYLRALLPHWWKPVRPDVYSCFFDGDDAFPIATDYIPQLRGKNPPSLVRAAERAGASPATTASLLNVCHAARTTAVWRDAALAAREISSDRKLYRRLLGERGDLVAEMQPRQGETVEDARRRFKQRMSEVLSRPTAVERALRRYNLLVQGSLAAVLGFCEKLVDDTVEEVIGAVDGERTAEGWVLHFTSSMGLPFLALNGPFEVRLGGALDGIYLCHRSTFRFGGRESSDVWGLSMRSLTEG